MIVLRTCEIDIMIISYDNSSTLKNIRICKRKEDNNFFMKRDKEKYKKSLVYPKQKSTLTYFILSNVL